ncbi:MAG TPA: OadG family protein [Candidatus Cloacimonadota bacterium]|nr:OadG family protein [Candidatus Cloacimonadota bacterium]HPS39209.1 OadG family protein [Candidatus Cloacimonadota bacterium]
MRKLTLIIALLALIITVFGKPLHQDNPAEASHMNVASLADSVVVQREQQIFEDYGIRESSTLREVAQLLKVKDLQRLKQSLGLEAANVKLDNRSLKQLGITPYSAFLASQTAKYGFSELSTVSDVAAKLNMPIKKLKQKLGHGLDPLTRDKDSRSLQSLDISPETVMQVNKQFLDNGINYSITLTVIGMLVVFFALLITSIIIGQLVHLNTREKKPVREIRISQSGKVISAPKDLNMDVIAAAIAALHIYEHTISERRRLVLTFGRNNFSQWRASASLNMPNRQFNRKRS